MDCYVIHQHSTCHIKQEKTHRAIVSYNGCLVSDRNMFKQRINDGLFLCRSYFKDNHFVILFITLNLCDNVAYRANYTSERSFLTLVEGMFYVEVSPEEPCTWVFYKNGLASTGGILVLMRFSSLHSL